MKYLLEKEINASGSVIFARMAVHHESAFENLSARFGAPPEEMPGLLQAIADTGAEPAFAFNVGSSVTDPDAYRHAMSVTRTVLEAMNQTQVHRGPDGFGYHLEGGTGLGHRRLSIIDLEDGGQPMFNEDESAVHPLLAVHPLPPYAAVPRFFNFVGHIGVSQVCRRFSGFH